MRNIHDSEKMVVNIGIRGTVAERDRLRKAATLKSMTYSTFARTHLLELADRIIAEADSRKPARTRKPPQSAAPSPSLSASPSTKDQTECVNEH